VATRCLCRAAAALPRLRLTLALTTVLALALAVIGATASAHTASAHAARHAKRHSVQAVPQGFVGVDVDGPMFAPGTPLSYTNQLASMVTNGVQSIRVAFNWAAAQPYQSWTQVPADQLSQFTVAEPRPTNFSQTDEIVGDAAERGISVLPTLLYAPTWDARNNPVGISTPMQVLPYAQYAAELVKRYGPNGTFWSSNPGIRKVPIRMWQIWNEPNISYYWHQPFARTYVPLLRAASSAIKQADPSAKVVLGALTNVAWRAIGTIYTMKGARHLFDVVSVNGFTKTPAKVMLYMRFMRSAMAHYGDGQKPLLPTEVSWPSAKGQTPQTYDFTTTEAGQARDIARLLPLIGAQRAQLHLLGFYYYTWIGDEAPGDLAFSFSGLLRLHNGTVTAKPALAAFRTGVLALERCRRKGSLATTCLKPAP
jgi:hypothetical protein